MWMSSHFRRGCLWVAWCLFAGISSQAHAVTMLIENPDGVLNGNKVRVNHRLSGFVGDYISLQPGEHEIAIQGPQEHMLIVNLSVDSATARVTQSRVDPRNCAPRLHTRWSAPTVLGAAKTQKKRAVPGHDGEPLPQLLRLQVEAPTFGDATGEPTMCSAAATMGCTKRLAIVDVDSVPRGAEIWIDGERINATTQSTLSVPFCEYQKAKHVLMRIPGRENCLREVAVADGVRSQLQCDLPMPPSQPQKRAVAGAAGSASKR
jgi:hypothetical protein